MIQDWELYGVQQDVDPEEVRRSTEEAQEMVTWMRKLDLSPREPVATDESTEAHDCEEIISTLLLCTEPGLCKQNCWGPITNFIRTSNQTCSSSGSAEPQ